MIKKLIIGSALAVGLLAFNSLANVAWAQELTAEDQHILQEFNKEIYQIVYQLAACAGTYEAVANIMPDLESQKSFHNDANGWQMASMVIGAQTGVFSKENGAMFAEERKNATKEDWLSRFNHIKTEKEVVDFTKEMANFANKYCHPLDSLRIEVVQNGLQLAYTGNKSSEVWVDMVFKAYTMFKISESYQIWKANKIYE